MMNSKFQLLDGPPGAYHQSAGTANVGRVEAEPRSKIKDKDHSIEGE